MRAGKNHRTATPRVPLGEISGKSPREIWDDYFRKRKPDPRATSRLILELHKAGKHEHVIAAIEAAMINGQGQPWMYDVLVGSMRIQKRPQAEINRVLASRIDLTGSDAASMMYTAAYFVRYGGQDLALRLYRQASRVDPTRPEPYILGLKLARQKKDYAAIQWAASGMLITAWTRNHRELHRQAENAAADAIQELKKAGREQEAATLKNAMAAARSRDIVLRLDWSGAGDLDLIIEEPPGTTCSPTNPQTTNGGVHVHDGFGPNQKNCFEEYICAQGMPGKYRVRIRHVYGSIVGKRATLTVIRGLGTPEESRRVFPVQLTREDRIVRLSLPKGRRTALAPVAKRQEILAGPTRGSRLRRVFRMTPGARRVGRQFSLSRRNLAAGQQVGFQPVITTLSEGVSMSAMAVVSGDRRYVRLTTVPLFSTITDVFTFSFVNTGNPNGGGGQGGQGPGGQGRRN